MKGFCFYLIIAAILLATIFVLAQSGTAFINSPDNNIFFTIETVSDNQTPSEIGKLVYSVSYQGISVIDKSALSLRLNNDKPLCSEVRIVSSVGIPFFMPTWNRGVDLPYESNLHLILLLKEVLNFIK